MKIFMTLYFLTTLLAAQKFSDVTASETEVIGTAEKKPRGIFVDETSLLVWQDDKNILLFKSVEAAKNYCLSMKTQGYSWRLPTLSELFSLSVEHIRPSMNPAISYGRSMAYLASDGPHWDNELHFGFNFYTRSMQIFKKNSRSLHVRCVAPLE